MQLYIMRHGNAVPSGHPDAERELTLLGEQEVQLMADWLYQQNIEIKNIFVSPYRRAQQTAAIVAQSFKQSMQSVTLDFITPSGSARDFHDFIDGGGHNGNVLVVSHMPLVSYLVEEFTAGQVAPIFQTAAIAHIAYNQETMSGELIKLIAPNDIV